MGLILVGGYFNKEKAVTILSNMKYYSSNFIEIESNEDITKRIGMIPFLMNVAADKSEEGFLCEKMLAVKSILDKSGDEAIDAYQELTSPKENELSDIKKFFPNDKWLADMLDELSIPMKKKEFEHYLDIYNRLKPTVV